MVGGPGTGLIVRGVLRQRWRSILGMAVILAVVAGIGLTALAGARRTQSAYPRFLRWANVSTMAIDAGGGRDFLQQVDRFPEVVQHRRYTAVDVAPLNRDGSPDISMIEMEALASADGRYFDQDRFVATEGRRPDPTRANEIAVNVTAAKQYRLHVGQRYALGTFDDDEISETQDPSTLRPKHRMEATIVGIGLFPEEVVQDESDRSPLMLLTPAYFRQVAKYGTYSWDGLVLRHGDRDVTAVKRRYHQLLEPGFPEFYRVTSVDTFHAQQAIRPVSLALALFGGIALVVAIVLTALGAANETRRVEPLRRDLRALGVSERQGVLAAAIGPSLAAVGGAAGAALLAIAASPTMPLGQVRRVEIDRGFDVDGTVVLLGALALAVVLIVVATLLAAVSRPRGVQARQAAGRPSRLAGAMSRLGLNPGNALGLRLAFGSRGDTAGPSVLLGGAIAIAALVSALTFSASLHGLVGDPEQYGWNWQGVAEAGAGYYNVDRDQIDRLVRADQDIETTTGVHFGSGLIDTVNVPLLGYDPGAEVVPPVLAGRAPSAPDEIALGSETARQLGKGPGDTVQLTTDRGVRTRRIVGLMVLPTLGIVHGAHTSLGTGAWVQGADVPGVARQAAGLPSSLIGPNALLIQLRPGRDGPAQIATLERHVMQMRNEAGVVFRPVQRPAEIVNTSDLDGAPPLLSGLLLGGALLALALTLTASVRRRRGELATLKSLGMTHRQLSTIVSWQSTGLVVAGLVVGVPLGIAGGRWLWSRFAHGLDVVALPEVPWSQLAIMTIGLIVVANLVAIVPGRLASRTAASIAVDTD